MDDSGMIRDYVIINQIFWVQALRIEKKSRGLPSKMKRVNSNLICPNTNDEYQIGNKTTSIFFI